MSLEFDALRRILAKTCGLSLEAEKAYLAETRLQPVLQRNGLRSLVELVQRIVDGADPVLTREVIEAMVTNETFFFRDRAPFEHFRTTILPTLVEARKARRRLRIWCAAASTGQEPYSLAMTLDEEIKRLAGWSVEIVATDISSKAIAIAREGRYSQFEVQRGLPISHLLRYFQRDGDSWTINEYLRSRVRFEMLNLLTSYKELGTFDVIFCRNVLIYFDSETKTQILRRMSESLATDGYLVLGSAETVIGLNVDLVPNAQNQSYNVRQRIQPLSSPLRLAANQ